MKIYVVIPAFNESTVIREVIESVLQFGYRVIVVDDGSFDRTGEIAAELPVILVRHSINLGQGAALETGMEAARRLNGDFVVHFDGDGQHRASEIQHLLKPLIRGECDIVFGSRFLNGKPVQAGIIKRIVLFAGRWINYALTGLLLSDAHNGFRALNKKALRSVHFEQSGMAHATEILACVQEFSLRYQEIPVHVDYTVYSKRKGQRLSESLTILFHLLFKRN